MEIRSGVGKMDLSQQGIVRSVIIQHCEKYRLLEPVATIEIEDLPVRIQHMLLEFVRIVSGRALDLSVEVPATEHLQPSSGSTKQHRPGLGSLTFGTYHAKAIKASRKLGAVLKSAAKRVTTSVPKHRIHRSRQQA